MSSTRHRDTPMPSSSSGDGTRGKRLPYPESLTPTPKTVAFSDVVEIKSFGDTPEYESDLSKSMDSLNIFPVPSSVTPDLIRESKLNYKADTSVNSESLLTGTTSTFRFRNVFDTANVARAKHDRPPGIKIKARSPNLRRKVVRGIQKKSPLPKSSIFIPTKKDNKGKMNYNNVSLPPHEKKGQRQSSEAGTPQQKDTEDWLMNQENTPFWWHTASKSNKSFPVTPFKSSSSANKPSSINDQVLPGDGKYPQLSEMRRALKLEIDAIDFSKLTALGKVNKLEQISSRLQKLDDSDFEWAMDELEKHLESYLIEFEYEKRRVREQCHQFPNTAWSIRKRLSQDLSDAESSSIKH